ncbi:50S ribosomal protein L21 [Formosa sediminum]|uniref:Large ribosomal subunit protein bL21 n=1 Tax=Formosa sediminum TaxID=2594004 RepID=A0A516GPQ5_9FLAO|nr:50S ribosomal protein L21 [Formosa sediminum]QDO93482.1 50S ribosomal protein L21 [Formosa sediminum]
MYAIVEIAGQQFKVEKDQKVFVHRLASEEGDAVSFDNVLLIGDGDNVTLGAPAIDGAQVSAKVLKHLQGDKVIVFKKKRRKGYRVKNGHRQALTEIVIESIAASGAKKAAPAKKAKKATATKADDLKKIEGAGPKAAEALVNAGIDTFAKVANTPAEKLSEVLTAASSRLSHIVTETWPKQAQLAADGKWDELKELQDRLDGGIEK